MNWSYRSASRSALRLARTAAIAAIASLLACEVTAQSTFAGNAQHTANYSTPAQSLNGLHWTTSIDLNNTGGYAHYGSPVMTPANTVLVPVKTGPTDGFKINAFNGGTGTSLYSLSTNYLLPPHDWIPTYQPVLATNSTETRLYYPGAGGTIYYINNVDSASHGAPVQQVFYTTLSNYQAHASNFNSTVFINTPITADSNGNVFFGFRVNGTAPAPLSTSQSGFARIDPNGNATYVLAGTAAGDANIAFDSHNSGPALSNDQTTIYVAVKSASTETYGYLLGLDSTTLATKYKVFLHDPRGNNANPATLLDDSTASPMVGPDNDVYFGIYGNPSNGSRGFLLHFSSDLTVEKAPGGFGWDYTPGVVPAGMVPSYTGTSPYLLFVKYNNYANAGYDSADGTNRIALLDPNSTEVDAHSTSDGMLIMREVLSVIGPTADAENRGSSLPYAVREWCINSPGVNPATKCVFMPSEDGNLYRWNLVTNSLDQFVHLNPGIGEPYVPTIVGPDGQVYTLNGGAMSVAGALNGEAVTLTSSSPDVRTTVTGQYLTLNVSVSNTGTSGFIPSGTVTITDTTYTVTNGVLVPTTTTLASNVTLSSSGTASYTSKAFTADKHFISVSYSGDSNFSPGTASLVQYVHAGASKITLGSSMSTSYVGQSVTFTATVASVVAGPNTPTGQVTFQDGTSVLAQVPVNGSGVAAFSTMALAAGTHTLTATYASDTLFAASSGSTVETVQKYGTVTTVSADVNPSVYSQPVTFTATVTPSGSGTGVPTGTVTFSIGGSAVATVPLNGGVATYTTATLSRFTHNVQVAYNGDSAFLTSKSSILVQTVNYDTSSTVLQSSANPSVYGQVVTFTATVEANAPGSGVPTGTVTFKNGSTTVATVNLDGNAQATWTTAAVPVGSATITATYGGSAGFITSTSALTQTVVSASTTTALASSANPSVYSQPVTFTATVTAVAPGGGVPSGTVTFKNGSTTVATVTLNGSGQATWTTSTLPVGSSTITAVYSGSASYNSSSSASITQSVTIDSTSTAVASSSNPSVYGQLVTFTATVTATAPGIGPPTGTVTFSIGGTVVGTVALSGGSATYTTPALSRYTHNIQAVYSGSSNFTSSKSAILVQTVTYDGTATALTSSANPSVYGQPVTFTATVTSSAPGSGVPTGTVTFKNGTANLGTVTLVNGGATLTTSTLTAGTHSITAVYSGSTSYLTSTSAAVTQTVNEDGTAASVKSSLNPSTFGHAVTFTATVTANAPGGGIPSGSVTFMDGTATLGTGTLINGSATFSISTLSRGTHSITVVYAGSANYQGSASQSLVQTVN